MADPSTKASQGFTDGDMVAALPKSGRTLGIWNKDLAALAWRSSIATSSNTRQFLLMRSACRGSRKPDSSLAR
jgi:hypothetical protein